VGMGTGVAVLMRYWGWVYMDCAVNAVQISEQTCGSFNDLSGGFGSVK